MEYTEQNTNYSVPFFDFMHLFALIAFSIRTEEYSVFRCVSFPILEDLKMSHTFIDTYIEMVVIKYFRNIGFNANNHLGPICVKCFKQPVTDIRRMQLADINETLISRHVQQIFTLNF